MRKVLRLSLPVVVASASALFAACVGDDPLTIGSSSGTSGSGGTSGTSGTSDDGGPTSDGPGGDGSSGGDGSAGDSGTDAGPPPCGYPGEECCAAPATPCKTGSTCGTATPKRCMVNEVDIVGEYQSFTNNTFPIVYRMVTAKWNGSTWTKGSSLTHADRHVDAFAVSPSGQQRVSLNKSGVGQYWFLEGVNWKDCSGAGTCAGPIGTLTEIYGITYVDNNFWLGGGNVFYRCVAPNRCVQQVTGLGGQTWAYGNFSGNAENDLWYSALTKAFHFDGVTWTVHPNLQAYAIHSVRKNDVWVGTSTLQHWNGAVWGDPVNVDGNPFPGNIYAIGGSDTNDLWAAGGSTLAHYDGVEWKKDLTFPAAATGVEDLYAPSKIEAFTVGDSKAYSFNGTTWAEMPPPPYDVLAGETQSGVKWRKVTGPAKARP